VQSAEAAAQPTPPRLGGVGVVDCELAVELRWLVALFDATVFELLALLEFELELPPPQPAIRAAQTPASASRE
jgi:hypothetical protein